MTPTSLGMFNGNIVCYVCGNYKIEIPVSYNVSGEGKKAASLYESRDVFTDMSCTTGIFTRAKFNKRVTARSTHKSQNLTNIKIKMPEGSRVGHHPSMAK